MPRSAVTLHHRVVVEPDEEKKTLNSGRAIISQYGIFSDRLYSHGVTNDPVHRPEYRVFLERLRAARKNTGMTQWDVARRLRKPQSYVSKSESGERRLDVIEASEFALLYGVGLDELVRGLLHEGTLRRVDEGDVATGIVRLPDSPADQ